MHEQPITEIVTSYLIHLIMTDIEVYAMRLVQANAMERFGENENQEKSEQGQRQSEMRKKKRERKMRMKQQLHMKQRDPQEEKSEWQQKA